MRLGLSHKELDALVTALSEIVDVYSDWEGDGDGGAGGLWREYQIWCRLLRRAEGLVEARRKGELCSGCGEVREPVGQDGRPVLVLGEPSDDRAEGEAGTGEGSEGGEMYPRMSPDHGEGLRDEGIGVKLPGCAESPTYGETSAKNWIRRLREALQGSAEAPAKAPPRL